MSSKKIRLDVYLITHHQIPSRSKAQALILAGRVKVGGQPKTKVGLLVSETETVEILEPPPFVSRGGEKLAGALNDFDLKPHNQVCLDVGSSTGGFTDCLLKKGAQKVVAVDVGKGQLDLSLRKDKRVVVHEETHILHLKPEDLKDKVTFCVIDVSFISLKKILSHIKELLQPHATVVALVKPQFEVGPKFLKKGVVRDEGVQKKAVQNILSFAKEKGFQIQNQAPSVLKGPKGNQEYFVYLTT